MKRQIIAVMMGAALIAAPLATNIATAQRPGGGRGQKMERLAKRLNLSDTQKSRLKEIRQRKKAQMKAVFTPEQLAKIEAAKAARRQQWQEYRQNGGARPQRRSKRALLRELNLSAEQKTELKRIRKSAKAEMKAVLTPEQRAQMQQLRQQRRQRRRARQQQQ